MLIFVYMTIVMFADVVLMTSDFIANDLAFHGNKNHVLCG